MRLPAKPLAAPSYETLKKGTLIHRIHLTTFAGNGFNPCGGGQSRFAPITNTKGKCVPSLYAGSSLDSTIFETVFHDVPTKETFKTVRKHEVTIRSHSELEVHRDIKLVKLYAPELKRWQISRQQLIASSANLYHSTARWAQAIHEACLGAEGLVWTSNQCDPDKSYLFFGGRVGSKDLYVESTRDGATDSALLSDVRRAGKRSGIVITL